MEIVVCMKWSPDTSEAEVELTDDGKDIERDDLDFDMNEWDRFAIEEAVQIKEKVDGKVTVVSVAPEDAEEMLRECLARGADEAFLLSDDAFEGSDGFATASILAKFIKDRPHDLVITGTLADDDCSAQVGGMLAGMLGVPVATLVSKMEVQDGKLAVSRELEAGLTESLEMDMPAVISVATGINEPRFVSIRAVRKVGSVDIPVLGSDDIGLDAAQTGAAGSRVQIERIELPPEGEGAEIIPGDAEEAAAKLAAILKEKGGIG